MLRLDGVRLGFDGFTLAADLEVARGGRLAVLGASGGGKSTLLSVIAGFLAPDRGRVWIDGADVTDAPVPARPLSVLFQEESTQMKDGGVLPLVAQLRQDGTVLMGGDPHQKPLDRLERAEEMIKLTYYNIILQSYTKHFFRQIYSRLNCKHHIFSHWLF